MREKLLLMFLLTVLGTGMVSGKPLMMEGTLSGLNSLMVLGIHGNTILAGGISNGTDLGDFDVILISLDENGRILWEKAYGGGARDLLSDLKVLPNGSAVVSGGTTSFGGGWIFEVDQNGRIIWSRVYNTDMIYSVVPYEGGFLAVSSASGKPLLMKLNGEGEVKDARVLNTSAEVIPLKISVLPGGDIFIGGMAKSPLTGSLDFWLAKVSEKGKLLWERTYGGNGTERLYDIEVDGQGVTLVGYTTSFGRSDVNLLAVRTDSEGKFLWARVMGGSREDWANSVSLLPSGELVLGGITYSTRSPQAWLVILSREGKVEKSLVMGTKGVDWIRAVRGLTAGNVILAGGINGTSNGAGSLLASRLFLGVVDPVSGDFTGCHVSVQRLDFPVKTVQVRVWTHSGGGSLGIRVISRSSQPKIKEVKNGLELLCPSGTSTTSPSSTTTTTTSYSITTSTTTTASSTIKTTHSENSESPSSARGRVCGPGTAVAVPLIVLWLRKKR